MNHELIETKEKKEELINIIKNNKIEKALIFCNKKREMEATVVNLEEQGMKAFSLYNGMEESDKEKVVKTFNAEEKVFIACSDSVAKKVNLEKINFIIGEDLPTRVNDYKTRLSYLAEDGIGFTMHDGENPQKIADINKFLEGKKEKKKEVVASKTEKSVESKKQPLTENKKSTTFEGHIPAFLQIDLSNILKKA